MSSSFTISLATPSDVTELGALLHSVKVALTINRLVWDPWPNTEKQLSIYTSSVKGGIETPGQDNWKAIDNETGKIVGYATGTISKKKEKEPRPIEAPAHGPWNPEVFKEIMGLCSDLEMAHDGEDHYGVSHATFLHYYLMSFWMDLADDIARHQLHVHVSEIHPKRHEVVV
jgi:hypothetical protein